MTCIKCKYLAIKNGAPHCSYGNLPISAGTGVNFNRKKLTKEKAERANVEYAGQCSTIDWAVKTKAATI
jgi:hypothetical protein